MPEEIITSASTTSTDSAAPVTSNTEPSVLSNSDQPVVSEGDSILDTAGAEEKAAIAAENKRLIEADPKTLSQEDNTKRDELVKAKQAADLKLAEEARAKGVPEKYDLKAPEGVTLNEVNLERVTTVFKENGLTQKQAQSMVDIFVALRKDGEEAQANNFKTFLETSAQETMKELGSNAKTELAYVARVKNLMSPETIEILSASGMGNQKCFIMDLAKIGRLFSEEKNVDTGKSVASTKAPEDILYPSMNKK